MVKSHLESKRRHFDITENDQLLVTLLKTHCIGNTVGACSTKFLSNDTLYVYTEGQRVSFPFCGYLDNSRLTSKLPGSNDTFTQVMNNLRTVLLIV